MGKKVKRKTYTSKGERRNCVNGIKEARQQKPEVDKALNKIAAWRAGKNPWVTVKGPSSNMRFIKARANSVWGDPKKIAQGLFGKDAIDE